MRIVSTWFTSPDQRRWLLQLLSLLLGFSLLVSSIWLYYQVRQLEQQQRQLMAPDP